MSKHIIELNDIESLVVLDALRMLQNNPDKHRDDKRIACNVSVMLRNVVSNDKKKDKIEFL